MTTHSTTPPAAQTREPLLPCAHCGGKADPEGWLANDGTRGPACDDCGSCAPDAVTWNKRATPAERPGDAALAERLRALDKMATSGPWRFHMSPTLGAAIIGPVSGVACDMSADDGLFVVALVNAYRAGALSPAPRDGGWLPIESAPRDGSSILLAWGGKSREGHWLDNTATRWPWAGWKVLGMLQPNGLPTHWRPLPAAPTEDGR